ncbi:hypothetical protein [Streptacidiphilus cavernicola]|uniref:Transcriptional regulator n=1 Tax=Streptacidiphilus cavernicola TaxID=3342716 RepID=A0ABV6VY06_9ACTN
MDDTDPRLGRIAQTADLMMHCHNTRRYTEVQRLAVRTGEELGALGVMGLAVCFCGLLWDHTPDDMRSADAARVPMIGGLFAFDGDDDSALEEARRLWRKAGRADPGTREEARQLAALHAKARRLAQDLVTNHHSPHQALAMLERVDDDLSLSILAVAHLVTVCGGYVPRDRAL